MENNSHPAKPIVITDPPKPHEEPLPADPEEVIVPGEDPDYDLIPDDEVDETLPYEPPRPGEGP